MAEQTVTHTYHNCTFHYTLPSELVTLLENIHTVLVESQQFLEDIQQRQAYQSSRSDEEGVV